MMKKRIPWEELMKSSTDRRRGLIMQHSERDEVKDTIYRHKIIYSTFMLTIFLDYNFKK